MFALFKYVIVASMALLFASLAPPAIAAELIMLEQPGCSWCERWNEEIGIAYPLTWEGRVAPLRRVDITQPWPQDLGYVAEDFYTPTFVLVENGRETSRLRGYPGDNFFWPLLDEMLAKLGHKAPKADSIAGHRDPLHDTALQMAGGRWVISL